jgi:Protein of unknown function (DUF3047)
VYCRLRAPGKVLWVFFVIFFVSRKVSMADNIVLGFDGLQGGPGSASVWRLQVRSGNADIKLLSENGEEILKLACRNSSYALERKVSVDISEYPYITWRWKMLKTPQRGDVRKKEFNDQALQILAAFENRKIISYVWDSNAPEGTISDESIGWPVNLSIKVIVVKSGISDEAKWIMFTRNIYQDYITLFHEEPGPLEGLRIQSNTQYTKDTAEGLVGKISFCRSR